MSIRSGRIGPVSLRSRIAGWLALPLVFALAPISVALAQVNAPPTANAGRDQVITTKDAAFLRGIVSDDGVPDPSRIAVTWSVVSGPGTVSFSNAREALTSATFSTDGSYVLRFTVSDGAGTATDDVAVTVRTAAATTLRVPADYSTIQAALDAAPANALVLVSPGTYVENLYIPRSLTLASTYYTTGERSAISQTIIRSPSTSAETIVVASGAGPDTRFAGFTVTGGKDGIKVRGAGVVQDNFFTGLGTDAVDFPRDTTGMVLNNVMEANGDDGVDINEASALVTGNEIRRNDGDGIENRVTNMVAPVDYVIIRDNRIVDNLSDGIQLIDDDAIASSPAQAATVFVIDRNIIARNAQAGIGMMDGGRTGEDYRGASLVERVLVSNNTFDGNNHGLVGGDNTVAVNNIFSRHTNIAIKNVDGSSRVAYAQLWSNGTDVTNSNVDSTTMYVGDPLLDSAYAPLPGSPVIDAGVASYTLPSGERALDLPPDAYRGTAPDLGAVESDAGGTGNRAPVVDAGADQTVDYPGPATLAGTASDDGQPNGTLTTTWSATSGPGSVTFADASSLTTTATFDAPGTYVLRLTASDSELTRFDELTVDVRDPNAPTTVERSIAAGSDDAEEYSGSVDLGSSDLELVTDSSRVQTVGLRFTGLQVPRGATITGATIQFQVDEVSTDTASLLIRAQAADNATTFTTATGNVSSRPRTTASVSWNPPAWPTTGARGADQRTPNLAALVQEVVNRPGWSAGNAMAFVVTGSGRRTAEAYEGPGAATLQISFSTGGSPSNTAPAVDAGPDQTITLPDSASLKGTVTDDGQPAGSTVTVSWSKVSGPGTVSFSSPTSTETTASFSSAGTYVLQLSASDGELTGTDQLTITVNPESGGGGTVTVVERRLAAGSDDVEERSAGKMDMTSSDLELVADGSTVQTVGIRFTNLAVPQGATVTNAWIQFTTDEVKTGSVALKVAAQAADNAPAFTTSTGNVSSRARTSAVDWAPPAWNTVDEAGTAQRTVDLSPVLQQVVSRTGWASGNAVAFIVTGSGTRTARAYESGAAKAALLHVEYRM